MIVGDTQQRLLAKLLEAKAGLTVDELAGAIDITRSAVKQHLTGMERSGYVQHTSSKSGGRPRFLYTLTESGETIRVRAEAVEQAVLHVERDHLHKERGCVSFVMYAVVLLFLLT